MKEFPRPVGQPMQKSEDKPGLHPFLTRPSSQLSTRKIIRTTFVVVLSGIAMFGAVIFFGLFRSRTALPRSSSPASTSRLPVVSLTPTAAPTTPATSRLSLVPTKDYGNKYKAGLLPVGDGKYVTSAAADRKSVV